jgi:hypothetical protein
MKDDGDPVLRMVERYTMAQVDGRTVPQAREGLSTCC